MTEQPTPAVLYAAKSTEDKHGSIPDQLADCRAMAEREGWAIVGEHTDEGFSAYSGNRGPGLEAARRRAADAAREHGGEAMLIVQHSDRLARGGGFGPGEAHHLVKVWIDLRAEGVTPRSVQDDESLRNLVLVAVMGERNHEDSRRKGEAVRAGLRRRAERGLFNGPPPYGYRRESGNLVVLRAEAEIVRRIFAEYLAGKSQQQIQRELNREGIPSQRGSRWAQPSIAKYLANPVYKGIVRLNGREYPGAHEPIVAVEVWEQAAKLREALARTMGGGHGPPPVGRHLFTNGILRCGLCGESLVPRSIRPRSKEGRLYEVYLCYQRVREGPDACGQPPVRRADVDGAFFAYFEAVGLDVDATRAQFSGDRQRRLTETRALREQAERAERQAAERLARVRRDYQDRRLDADDWREQRQILAAELVAAEAEAARLAGREVELTEEADLAESDEALVYLARLRASIAGKLAESEDVAAVRAAMLTIFEGFTLRPWHKPAQELAVEGGYLLDPAIRVDAIDPRLKGSEAGPLRRIPLRKPENGDPRALIT